MIRLLLLALVAGQLAGHGALAQPNDFSDCIREDHIDNAIAACTRAIASGRYRGRELFQLYYKRGIVLSMRREYDRAIADFAQALKINPKHVGALVNRGANLYDKARASHRLDKRLLGQAVADLNQAVRFAPKDANALYERGKVLEALEEYDRAIADYTAVIRLKPETRLLQAAYHNRGNARSNKKDYREAIADYTEAIRLAPQDALIYYVRGTTYFEMGELDRAIADFDQAIAFDPKLFVAFINRGHSWHMKGEFDRAIADATEAIKLYPHHNPYGLRAKSRHDKGEYKMAIEDFNEAIKLAPKHAIYYEGRARSWHALGEITQAERDLAQAKLLSGGATANDIQAKPAPAPLPQSLITVVSATLGRNCGVPRGNVTKRVAAICNGREVCALPGSRVNNPDPAFGCAKAFEVEWRCDGRTGTRRASVPAVVDEKRVLTLSCK